MHCVMVKYPSGSVELVDTYPDKETANEEKKALARHAVFLKRAGVYPGKLPEYFVEKEEPLKRRPGK